MWMKARKQFACTEVSRMVAGKIFVFFFFVLDRRNQIGFTFSLC